MLNIFPTLSTWINRISINYRIARYTSLLDSIDNDSEFDTESDLYITDDEKKYAISQISGPIYTQRKIRGMVLLRLDFEVSDKMAHYDHPKITVEHVMPQNPSKDSQWSDWCPDEDVHQELVHCLGNLALLSRNKNSAASNYEFNKKKTSYFNPVSGHTAFVLTNQVIAEDEWRPETIRVRQTILVNTLIKAWDLIV